MFRFDINKALDSNLMLICLVGLTSRHALKFSPNSSDRFSDNFSRLLVQNRHHFFDERVRSTNSQVHGECEKTIPEHGKFYSGVIHTPAAQIFEKMHLKSEKIREKSTKIAKKRPFPPEFCPKPRNFRASGAIIYYLGGPPSHLCSPMAKNSKVISPKMDHLNL